MPHREIRPSKLTNHSVQVTQRYNKVYDKIQLIEFNQLNHLSLD